MTHDRTKIGAVLYVQQKDLGGVVCERAVGAGFTDDKTHGWEEVA